MSDIEPPMVTDNCDGNVSYDVSHNVDTSTPGVYIVTFTASDYSGNSTSSQVEVTVFDPLSISENYIENIYLYPNPAKNLVTINNIFSHTNISIYDMLGKQYQLNGINNFENNTLSINTSSLDTGIYFFRIEDINTRQLKTLRLIKK